MNISVGASYHIKDSFFNKVNDSFLMSNKEDSHYRPHFFFFADPDVEGIYWAVPQSSKVQKFKSILDKKTAKYGTCDTIVIGNFGGTDNVFLIQNMFPIIDKYVDHEHTINGKRVTIHTALSKEIVNKALKVLRLHKYGQKLVFPDIDRIYLLMESELSAQSS